MRFTDGFWNMRAGVDARYARHASRADPVPGSVRVLAPTRPQHTRGDTLNTPVLSVTIIAPLRDVLKVRIEHHAGVVDPVRFDTAGDDVRAEVEIDESVATVRSGSLEARIRLGAGWETTFSADGTPLTASRDKAVAWIMTTPDADADTGVGNLPHVGGSYLHEQLDLGVGGLVYGLGEEFGPLVKNGQSIQTWNADGAPTATRPARASPSHPCRCDGRDALVFVAHVAVHHDQVDGRELRGHGVQHLARDRHRPAHQPRRGFGWRRASRISGSWAVNSRTGPASTTHGATPTPRPRSWRPASPPR